MIKVLRDNTKETYYTKCKNCNSELEYEYSDVTTIELSMSYHTEILCPVCGKDTMAELTSKDDYKDSLFPFKQTNPLTAAMNCCTPLWNSPNE